MARIPIVSTMAQISGTVANQISLDGVGGRLVRNIDPEYMGDLLMYCSLKSHISKLALLLMATTSMKFEGNHRLTASDNPSLLGGRKCRDAPIPWRR